MNKKSGFTLVELIVTISILAILATVAFISFTSYTKSARDGKRLANIDQIETALDIFHVFRSKYPEPSTPVDVTYSGAIVWTQGTFGELSRQQTGKIFGDITDPLYKNNYDYSVTNSRKEYQLTYVLEGGDNSLFSANTSMDPIPQSYAAAPFLPSELNPIIWLDALDVDGDGDTGDNPSNGTTLSSWVNKGTLGAPGNPTLNGTIRYALDGFDNVSGNGEPAVFISSASTDGIVFNGSNITNGSIIYVVQNYDPFGTTDTNGVGLQSTTSNQRYIGYYSTYRNSLRIGSAPNFPTSSPASTAGRTLPTIFEFHKNNSNYSFFDTGWPLAQGSTNSISGNTWAINKGGMQTTYADFVVSEVLVFNTILSAEDIQKVQGYIAHKWGEEGYMPSNHPYKSTPPISNLSPPETIVSGTAIPQEEVKSNIYITGNYNGLFTHSISKISGLHYIFVTPSITASRLDDTNFINIASQKKLVYNGYDNYPAGYVQMDSDLTSSGGFDEIRLLGPVVFEGTKEELASYTGLKQVDNAVRASYQNTTIYPKVSQYLDNYGTSYVENILSNIIGINPIKPYYCSDILDKRFTYNIAPQAHINASPSTLNGLTGTGGIANGVISTQGNLDYEYHSDNTNAFIEFNWDTPQPVGFVRIYNRTGCCTSRLSGATISLYGSTNTLLYSHTLWNTEGDYVIDLDLEGIGHMYSDVKKLVIESHGVDSQINLREVEIYVGGNIQDGFYLVDSDGVGGRKPYDVYCDMMTDGGGWTRIQDNHIERGDFSGGFHSPNYDQDWNRENNIEPLSSPIDSGYVMHQRLSIDTSVNAQQNTEYEISLTDKNVLEPGQEIRISAWVADAWNEGTNTNGGKGYIFHNRLSYTDGSSVVNGLLETLEEQTVGGKLWKHQMVRIPVEKEVSDFKWYVGYGTETNLSRDFYFTDLRAEIYYR